MIKRLMIELLKPEDKNIEKHTSLKSILTKYGQQWIIKMDNQLYIPLELQIEKDHILLRNLIQGDTISKPVCLVCNNNQIYTYSNLQELIEILQQWI